MGVRRCKGEVREADWVWMEERQGRMSDCAEQGNTRQGKCYQSQEEHVLLVAVCVASSLISA